VKHPINTLLAALVLGLSAAVQAEPAFESRLIFPKQEKHVHSSSIAQLPNGDFLAVWFHGSGERTANDVVVQGARLKQGDTEWSEVFLAAKTPNVPDCNPVLFVDRNDKLWLFWQSVWANRWERGVLKYRTSTDYLGDGPPNWNWQDVMHLDPGDEFPEDLRAGFQEIGWSQAMWAEYAHPYTRMLIEAAADPIKRIVGWMPRATPLQLENGRFILPLYSDGYNISSTAYSDDDGETWTLSKPIVGLGPIQPSIVQKRDGTLVAYMRDSGEAPKRVQIATSTDNSETWSISTDTDIPNPSSTTVVCVLDDGRWVMILNDTERGRHRLAAAISDDEGETWKAQRYLEEDETERSGFSYPNLIQARDGLVHVTYSYHRPDGRSIKHVAFDADWILE